MFIRSFSNSNMYNGFSASSIETISRRSGLANESIGITCISSFFRQILLWDEMCDKSMSELTMAPSPLAHSAICVAVSLI